MPEPQKIVVPQASNPTITSKNLPPEVPREVLIQDDEIVAKPLKSPNFINLKHVNPNMSIRWVACKVGEKESGRRYDECLAQGFLPCKPEEIVQLNGQALPPSLCKDGRIINGDTILMKMPKVDYIGAMKYNEQSARIRVKKPGVAIQGDPKALQNADARVNPQGAGFPKHPQVSTYVPQLAEVDSKTADNSGPEINLATK